MKNKIFFLVNQIRKWLKDLQKNHQAQYNHIMKWYIGPIIAPFNGVKKSICILQFICNFSHIKSLINSGWVYSLHKWNKQRKVLYKKTDLNRHIVQKLKPVLEQYSPTWYICNKWLAIMVGEGRGTYCQYIRTSLRLSDGEELSLDWFPREYKSLAESTPIVVFCPGITGDSLDNYSVKFAQYLREQLGWRTCVANKRGFADTPLRVFIRKLTFLDTKL